MEPESYTDVPLETDIVLDPNAMLAISALAPVAGKVLAALIYAMEADNRFSIPYHLLRERTGLTQEGIRKAVSTLGQYNFTVFTKIGAGGNPPALRGMVNPAYAQRVGSPSAGLVWAKLTRTGPEDR